MTPEQWLAHHGVKGMKWGKRKTRTKREAKAIDRRIGAREARRTLSDKDLKNYVERLQNEKKLKDLVDADVNSGRTMAKRIASESGQRVVKTVAAGAALYAVKAALSKEFSLKDAAGFLAPKPKK